MSWLWICSVFLWGCELMPLIARHEAAVWCSENCCHSCFIHTVWFKDSRAAVFTSGNIIIVHIHQQSTFISLFMYCKVFCRSILTIWAAFSGIKKKKLLLFIDYCCLPQSAIYWVSLWDKPVICPAVWCIALSMDLYTNILFIYYWWNTEWSFKCVSVFWLW